MIYVLTWQEWEALTGQLVSDVRGEMADIRAALPRWIDEERAYAVALLKVRLHLLKIYLKLCSLISIYIYCFANSLIH